MSIDVVLSPCVHSGRRPKPRQARDGHSWRMAAALLVLPAGPASVLPTFTGGVWKAGVRSIRSEPCEGPHARLAVVRGGSREARRGAPSFPPRAFRSAHRVWVRPARLPPSRGRVGRCVPPRHTPFPNGLACARLARDPRGAPGAFQADLQRCPVLSGGGVSRFSDVCALPCAVRPLAVFLCEVCVRLGVEASGKTLCVCPPLRERGTMNRLSRAL